MLPKPYRLTKNNDFQNVFQNGRVAGGSFLAIKAAPNTLTHCRIGFVVSKKVSNKATDRNRVKRRLREAMRGFLPQFNNHFDMVLLTKKEIKDKEFGQIKEEMGALLKRARLIK
ncbi:MAG: ribonuclease P protein component [Candidatus Pacebacteria bacterium]|nr:ribonuclease P protein component [Candidatus Paceibacterota bacterium]